MVVLGVFTFLEVNFDIGVAIILVGVAMYLFNWWARRKMQPSLK